MLNQIPGYEIMGENQRPEEKHLAKVIEKVVKQETTAFRRQVDRLLNFWKGKRFEVQSKGYLLSSFPFLGRLSVALKEGKNAFEGKD